MTAFWNRIFGQKIPLQENKVFHLPKCDEEFTVEQAVVITNSNNEIDSPDLQPTQVPIPNVPLEPVTHLPDYDPVKPVPSSNHAIKGRIFSFHSTHRRIPCSKFPHG